MIKFALVGNPNSGKTTLFNGLTGSTAHVGNWPGVTVDKREGIYKKCPQPITIVDLPGIYSLSPYTQEEVIARNFILQEKPQCIINIVDATNLERNLYLTTQLLETDIPVVVALNMIDVVRKNGNSINGNQLQEQLGVPVVEISALRGEGLAKLMDCAFKNSTQLRRGKTVLEITSLYPLICDITAALRQEKVENALFHAVKLVEKDQTESNLPSVSPLIQQFQKEHPDIAESDFPAIVADGRYKFITEKCSSAVIRKSSQKFQLTASDKADKVLTHKIWGIPIFLVILFAVFHLTFSENFLFLSSFFHLPSLQELGLLTPEGEPISYGVRWLACIYDGAVYSPGVVLNNIWNDMLVGELLGRIQVSVENSGMASWAIGLVNSGIIDGLGAVLSFLPPILVLFLFFSILEDSGYMARIAFILDRVFRRFGLSGRAFMPMIMGFGCSVPAMINTRTLADSKERIATIRVIPFFSCGAKLPILTAVAGGIVSYFGVGNADIITYAMYLLGIVTAILSVLLLRSTTLKGETPPFIMELPSYHLPQLKNLLLHLWDKTKHFIKKAFTIILASTIVIWALTHFTFDWQLLDDSDIDKSILAGLSQMIQPLFTPLGFGSQLGKYGWVFGVAVVSGLIAKENVIATFSTLAVCLAKVANIEFGGLDVTAGDGIDAVQAMIMATGITMPALISFIAFNMTTIPCFAAVGTAKGELPDGKSYRGTILFWLATSYTVSAIIYTVGSFWWTSFVWIAFAAIVASIIIVRNKKKKKVI